MKREFLLKRFLTITAALSLIIGIAVLNTSCASLAKVGAAVGQATGTMTPQQADSLVKSAEAVEKTFEDITPEQEYYIGRAVGATIISQYKVYNNKRATEYLNVVGQTVAKFSDMPETFKGYRFLILDTEEINAFAAPGGFIFISRGMIRLCESEDDLASVVAHEVGHVQLKHAVKAIKGSRINSALTTIAIEGTKTFAGDTLASLTEAFEGSIDDIANTMMNSGYAKGQERKADKAAITMLKRMGYRQQSLVYVLQRMDEHVEVGGGGFGSTHPPATSRIKDLKKIIDDAETPEAPQARQTRFAKMLKKV